MDRGAWRAIVHGVAKSWTQLSNSHTHTHTHTHKQLILKINDLFILEYETSFSSLKYVFNCIIIHSFRPYLPLRLLLWGLTCQLELFYLQMPENLMGRISDG